MLTGDYTNDVYEPKSRYFGSIWAVGLTVFPPVRTGLLVPARFVSHAPAASRALYSIPQLAAFRLQCLPRPTVRPSTRPVAIAWVLLLYIDAYRLTDCRFCKDWLDFCWPRHMLRFSAGRPRNGSFSGRGLGVNVLAMSRGGPGCSGSRPDIWSSRVIVTGQVNGQLRSTS